MRWRNKIYSTNAALEGLFPSATGHCSIREIEEDEDEEDEEEVMMIRIRP
jgi:hypothetical protein